MVAMRPVQIYGRGVIRFIVRSVVLAALVCLTVLVLSFALSRASSNVAISIAGPEATAADIARINHDLGLDRPLPVQFLDWATWATPSCSTKRYRR